MPRVGMLIIAVLLAAAPAAGQFFGGSASGDKVTFILCHGVDCYPRADATNRYIITAKSKPQKCFVTAKVPPQGAAITVDILINGSVSIFPAAAKLTIPAGGTAVYSTTSFVAGTQFQEGDYLTASVVSVGTSTAGRDVTAVCSMK